MSKKQLKQTASPALLGRNGGPALDEPVAPTSPVPEVFEIISIEEAARRIGCSKFTVYRAVKRGDIHGVVIGKRKISVNWGEIVRRYRPEARP